MTNSAADPDRPRRLAAAALCIALCAGAPPAARAAACALGQRTPDQLAAAFEKRRCRKGDALIFIAAGPPERAALMIGRFCDLRAQVVTAPGPGALRTVVCLADPKPLRPPG